MAAQAVPTLTENPLCKAHRRERTFTSENSKLYVLPVRKVYSRLLSSKQKRTNHNEMERKRRQVQRSRLADLRDVIPSLRVNDKATTTVIIKTAREYIQDLQVIADTAQPTIQRLERENEALKAHVETLQDELLRLQAKQAKMLQEPQQYTPPIPFGQPATATPPTSVEDPTVVKNVSIGSMGQTPATSYYQSSPTSSPLQTRRMSTHSVLSANSVTSAHSVSSPESDSRAGQPFTTGSVDYGTYQRNAYAMQSASSYTNLNYLNRLRSPIQQHGQTPTPMDEIDQSMQFSSFADVKPPETFRQVGEVAAREHTYQADISRTQQCGAFGSQGLSQVRTVRQRFL